MTESEPAIADAGLGALIEAHRPELRRFLAARCGDAADADDLLQELWLKSVLAATGPIANGRAYLFRMANNLVLDRARTRRRAMQRDRAWLERGEPAAGSIELQMDPAPDAEASLIEAEEADLLRRAVAALPEGARRALLLYRFEGRGQTEIAQIMGISRSGVEKHLALAMKHLRTSLRDCGFFGTATSHEQQTAGDAAPNRNSRP
uniref:RNA polymerase sigma factor n=1 Tax=Altererythrobacter segetis TaxID=1104773 RepID=UPI00140B58E2|nr:RNA polymerase sigma factor [Altererythrobacter segetis]